MVLEFKVSRTLIEMFKDGAKKDYNEYCGLLAGKDNEVRLLQICENIQKSPTLFEIAPDQLISCHKEAFKHGWDIIGNIHSHPTFPAFPSPTDEMYMKVNRYVWIIYSCIHDNYFGYILNDKDIIERVELNE